MTKTAHCSVCKKENLEIGQMHSPKRCVQCYKEFRHAYYLKNRDHMIAKVIAYQAVARPKKRQIKSNQRQLLKPLPAQTIESILALVSNSNNVAKQTK